MSYTREESCIRFCADTPCHINTIAKNAKKHLFIIINYLVGFIKLQVLVPKKKRCIRVTLIVSLVIRITGQISFYCTGTRLLPLQQVGVNTYCFSGI